MNWLIKRLDQNEVGGATEACALFWDVDHGSENLTAFLANPANVLLVAEGDGRPVGLLLGYVLQRWDDRAPMAFLYAIDVLEDFQRQGIGRQLVENFLEAGRKAGCGEGFVITNHSNEAARALYEATGGIMADGDELMYEWNL